MAQLYLQQTWADDDARYPLSAARLSLVEQGIFDVHYQPGCKAYANFNVTLANNTLTRLTLNNELYDSDTMHDNVTNPGRITINSPGLYLLQGNVGFLANGAGTPGERDVNIELNGTTFIAQSIVTTPSVVNFTVEVEGLHWMNTGDYIQLAVLQNSGIVCGLASLAEAPSLSAQLLSFKGPF